MKILLFAILFISIVLLILFWDRIRQSKLFQSSRDRAVENAARKAAKEEEYFRRTANKYYYKEEKAEFGKDYFKSTDEQSGQATGQATGKATDGARARDNRQASTADTDTARRRTTSSEGVTIIDERQRQKAEKKIFEDNEGEYVEFEEV
jgi:hypothetical protein